MQRYNARNQEGSRMARSSPNAVRTELRRLLKKAPNTETMELLIPDIHGTLKGKRICVDDFDKACGNGFNFCAGILLMTTLGHAVEGLPYSEIDGDPDVACRLVPGSLAPVPWAERPMAQALFRMYEESDRPLIVDSRTILERALTPLYKKRLTVVMAVELEFYLLHANSEPPKPGTPTIPGTAIPQPGTQVYSPDDLWEIDEFLNDVYAYCAAQNIPADAVTSEFAQGQFELNLRHIDDPVLACDHAVLLKRAVKAAARKHGFVACFMAKPFTPLSGSGMHIHMSVLDRNGVNYFSHGRKKLASPPFSARLRHAVGGVLKTMAESTAIFAPNANSYRRLRPESFAPVEPNWGANHRCTAIRIPLSDEKNLRLEHRCSGADANPYLVTAAIVASIHWGLKNKKEPEKMIEEGGRVTPRTRLPVRWDAALDKFSRSKVLPEYLGTRFCKYYALNRREESRQFHNTVTAVDFEWYLRSV